MTNQELCTQYELFLELLKDNKVEEVIKILERAVKRMDKDYEKDTDKE